MNTNTMELNLNEMEQANGGFSLKELGAKIIMWHIVHFSNEPSNAKDSNGRGPVDKFVHLSSN